MDANKPEPAPIGTGREITPLVIEDLKNRSEMGAKKYGETLHARNGRNAIVDLYQELLDAIQYLRQQLEENTKAPTSREYLTRMANEEEGYISVGGLAADVGFPVNTESIAQEAHRIVLGDRGESYGHPIFDMTRTADMLTALLRDKLRPGARFEAEDIAQAMMCVKQSRERNRHKRDNQTDTAGYALTKEMIGEWRAANPGVDPRDVFPIA